jgi:hypothetical protein
LSVKHVTFLDDYEGVTDPSRVYEARVGTERPNCSDLYTNDGELAYKDVPDELLSEVIINHVVKTGRDFKVIASIVNGKPNYVTIAAGSVLLKIAARSVYPHFLVMADESIPPFWIGKNSKDQHYQSNDQRQVIFK